MPSIISKFDQIVLHYLYHIMRTELGTLVLFTLKNEEYITGRWREYFKELLEKNYQI